jgi:hypothetical protein
MRPGVSMGYFLLVGSANVALPYFLRPSSGSASRRRWIFFGTITPAWLNVTLPMAVENPYVTWYPLARAWIPREAL